MKILHCFADEGVESECLQAYGEVYRIGLDPRDTNESRPIQADAQALPIQSDVTFDLGLFHPPCQKWAVGSHVQCNPDERHENLIPVARDIAVDYCDDWIIENVTQAPLNNPVTLNGGMFGSPLHYERAFETSYHVPQPRNQTRLCDPPERIEDHHANGGFQGSKQVWKTLKGYSGEYHARSFKREAIPRAYLDYLIRPLL
jgi:hypothetical protein